MTAWLFPGQGSQRPGMANGFSACAPLVKTAEEIVGAPIRWVCCSPTNDVWPADLVQPAIYLTDVGGAQALAGEGLVPEAVLGHSLGEYAALVAAGSLSFEDGLRLVSVRGAAMMRAGRKQPGGMAAVLGLEAEKVHHICAEGGAVWVANLNSPLQTVISGSDISLASAAKRLREAGGRVVRLQVPVAAHTPLMKAAVPEVRSVLDQVEIKPPAAAFFSSVDGKRHEDPAEIRRLLLEQIVGPVRFEEAVRTIAATGTDHFVEVGPGDALSGLVKRILSDVRVDRVDDDEKAYAFSSPSLKEQVT